MPRCSASPMELLSTGEVVILDEERGQHTLCLLIRPGLAPEPRWPPQAVSYSGNADRFRLVKHLCNPYSTSYTCNYLGSLGTGMANWTRGGHSAAAWRQPATSTARAKKLPIGKPPRVRMESLEWGAPDRADRGGGRPRRYPHPWSHRDRCADGVGGRIPLNPAEQRSKLRGPGGSLIRFPWRKQRRDACLRCNTGYRVAGFLHLAETSKAQINTHEADCTQPSGIVWDYGIICPRQLRTSTKAGAGWKRGRSIRRR